MAIPVKLEVFEGPLDLLLHLIEKNKINIYDIPIALITEQYMEYLKSIEKHDLDNMSEFLVMAATLLKIKSRLLLPKEEIKEEPTEDPSRELLERLRAKLVEFLLGERNIFEIGFAVHQERHGNYVHALVFEFFCENTTVAIRDDCNFFIFHSFSCGT